MSLLSSSEAQQVKKLRKQVLLSLQLSDDDKASKKAFKKAVQGLEADEKIKLDADGTISLLVKKAKKKKKEKKEKKEKKRKLEVEDNDDKDLKSENKKSKKGIKKEANSGNDEESKSEKDLEGGEGNDNDDNDDGFNTVTEKTTTSSIDKNKPCKGNPQGCTRLFVGNLPFAVDEASLASFLPGQVTHIKWITDKETGKFYGSAFIEMDNSQSAADAVAMAGEKLIGRPIKINFAPARDGDVWPPKDKVVSGGGHNKNNSGQAGGSGVKAMSAKPDGCIKLFCGNLSYEIDDEAITKFFASVDAELKAVRWIHHKDCKFCVNCLPNWWQTRNIAVLKEEFAIFICTNYHLVLNYIVNSHTRNIIVYFSFFVLRSNITHKNLAGDFKGVGFAEFWNTEACEKAASLNGKNLLGRPIRLDWSD